VEVVAEAPMSGEELGEVNVDPAMPPVAPALVIRDEPSSPAARLPG